MLKKYNWAILGPGSIAVIFADALTGIEGGQLLGVASRDSAKSSATKYLGRTVVMNICCRIRT
ncbi:MAG: hypothetical protein ACI9C4_001493 [Paraglaciecola sp.]|jgi:hypothetical protein